MKRILVTGSRFWEPWDLVREVLTRVADRHGEDVVIVHGACPTGIDRCFAKIAFEMGITCHPIEADWARYGKPAGPKRNSEMVALGASFAMSFSEDLGTSKGTRDCVEKCIRAEIPVWHFSGPYPECKLRIHSIEQLDREYPYREKAKGEMES